MTNKKRYTDTGAYLRMLRRMIRAAGNRIAHADIADLVELIGIQADLNEAIRHAVAGLRADGYSYADIGEALGLTGQAVYYRYGKP